MRELEFLPDWYPQLRRRKRLLKAQLWLALGLLLGLGTWFVLVERNVDRARTSLEAAGREMAQSDQDLKNLKGQVEIKDRLRLQEQIVSRLGVGVEMTRLLYTLERIMPREMTLMELTLDTVERQRAVTSAASARAAASKDAPSVERRLKVKLVGVTPNDSDIATLLAGLNALEFFDQIMMTYARNRVDEGHVMREFEVTFGMELDPTAAPAVAQR